MPLLCITFGDTLQVISSTKVFSLISFQSFSTNANHKATEASAMKEGKEWKAPDSDVLEVLQWSVLIKMKHLYGSI